MAWREDIADRARNGDVDGVLKIFDELWNDRQRGRTQEAAYLKHIEQILKAGNAGKPLPTTLQAEPKTSDVLDALGRAREAATDALRAATARVGAP